MTNMFHVIIPARYHSSRLPGKLLMDINGVSVLERVWRQAVKAAPLSVIIATDSIEIAEHAQRFGADICMTRADHPSGTDRIAEVVKKRPYLENSVIVNVQGDEPFIDPCLIQQVAEVLVRSKASVATLCWPIDSLEQLNNPNVVKVVFNRHYQAMYFSRSPIPFHRDVPDTYTDCWRHIGLYAYQGLFLTQWNTLSVCSIEQHECLEQLRVLWSGYSIAIEPAQIFPLQDINTHDDLLKARQFSEIE